jgi:hypothetical protein
VLLKRFHQTFRNNLTRWRRSGLRRINRQCLHIPLLSEIDRSAGMVPEGLSINLDISMLAPSETHHEDEQWCA